MAGPLPPLSLPRPVSPPACPRSVADLVNLLRLVEPDTAGAGGETERPRFAACLGGFTGVVAGVSGFGMLALAVCEVPRRWG